MKVDMTLNKETKTKKTGFQHFKILGEKSFSVFGENKKKILKMTGFGCFELGTFLGQKTDGWFSASQRGSSIH